MILDTEGNKCQEGTECGSGKIKFIPGEICIKTEQCNLNIYKNNNTHCGLCKYFDQNGAKYKLVGSESNNCLSEIPDGAEEYNEDLHLLRCKSGYILSGDICETHCYEFCATCSDYSTDVTQQKCLTCKEGYLPEEENSSNCKKIIPTTIITTIPTTIITTIPTTIITTIPTTIITTIPTTIITTIPTTAPAPPEVECLDEKCLTCSEESNKYGLCLSCNETGGYKKVNYTIVYTQFLDCVKQENSKLNKYYYNEEREEYSHVIKHVKSV